MPNNQPQTSGGSHLNPTSKMSFAVAGCAFAAAVIGVLINQWMSGWMAVGGMAGVGLFYLAIGLLNLGGVESIYSDESELVESASHRLSGAANVDDLAVEHSHEAGTRTESLAKSHH